MEYLWICGTSGVGKASFINKLLDADSHELRQKIGINDACTAYGPDFCDDSLDSLLKVNSAFAVIKWQFKTHKRIKELIEQKPDENHRAILLWRPFDDQIVDLRKRSAWAIRDSVMTLQHDWEIIRRLFTKMRIDTRLIVQFLYLSEKETELKDWK